MGPLDLPEKRRHRRKSPGPRLVLFLPGGGRETADALDVSPGGALVRVRRIIASGSLVVVEEPSAAGIGESMLPHLVAKVSRMVLVPAMAAAVEWVKAVAPDGIDQLVAFIRRTTTLELPPETVLPFSSALADTPVSYTFENRRIAVEKVLAQRKNERYVNLFGIKVREGAARSVSDVKVIQTESPRQRRATMSEDDLLKNREDVRVDPVLAAREMQARLDALRGKRQVSDEVTLVREGQPIRALCVAVDISSLFVESTERLPDVATRTTMKYVVPTARGPHEVVVVLQVVGRFRNAATNKDEALLRIITANEGDRQGAFWRYLSGGRSPL
jgi:hypothetical protein